LWCTLRRARFDGNTIKETGAEFHLHVSLENIIQCASSAKAQQARKIGAKQKQLDAVVCGRRHRARANLHKVVQVREPAHKSKRERERARAVARGRRLRRMGRERELVWTAECAARDGGGSVCGACQGVRVRETELVVDLRRRSGAWPAAGHALGQDADAHRTCWAMCCGCRCC
jgi:hypothetical protein